AASVLRETPPLRSTRVRAVPPFRRTIRTACSTGIPSACADARASSGVSTSPVEGPGTGRGWGGRGSRHGRPDSREGPPRRTESRLGNTTRRNEPPVTSVSTSPTRLLVQETPDGRVQETPDGRDQETPAVGQGDMTRTQRAFSG